MKLSKLYSRSTTGKICTWEIEISQNKYRTISGFEGMKLTTSDWTTCKAKTYCTADQQALKEATAIHRTKIGTGSFENDPSIPNKSSFVNLEIPPSGSYYIITPSLNDATFQAAGKFTIAQYAFVDETDLWENGWKCQNGTPGVSDPLATQDNWNKATTNGSWGAPPFNFDNTGGTPGNRAQIVANVLALTNNSNTIQSSEGISPRIKGAIVLAGKSTVFDNDTYRNLVPLKN